MSHSRRVLCLPWLHPYPGVRDWVHEWLAPVITVELGPGMSGCAQWWRHP
jgi:hypothetical protein